jgi:hypothetical protein
MAKKVFDKVRAMDTYDRKYADDKTMFNVIGLTIRPGVMLWAVRLEHEFYPPRTEKNKLYQFSIVNWENMQFIVVTFPIVDRSKAESLARSCDLRFADSLPTVVESGGPKSFPMYPRATNVWTLENVGTNWTNNFESLHELQDREIERILGDDADLRSGKINLDV